MSFESRMVELIQRYMREEKGRYISQEEIWKRPRWERVWVWWKALEKYEGYEIDMSMEECKKIYGRD